MNSKIKCLSVLVVIYLFSFVPANAAVDVDRLDNARASITAKHYHQGYAQFEKMANKGCPFSQLRI